MLGGAIVLYGVAIYESVRETPRYLQEHDREEIDRGAPLGAKEETVLIIKIYRVPLVIYALATLNAVGAYNIQNHTIMTLTTGLNTLALAYNKKISEFDDYKNAVIEKIGEHKENQISNVIAQEAVDKVISPNAMVYETGEGDVIFMDKWTGIIFKSCQNAVDRAFLILEEDLKNDDWVPVERLYDILFEHNRKFMPKVGSNKIFGWELEKCANERRYGNVLIDHKIDSTYSPNLQQAVTVLEYVPQAPKGNWWY
jgi:hypothetical protein